MTLQVHGTLITLPTGHAALVSTALGLVFWAALGAAWRHWFVLLSEGVVALLVSWLAVAGAVMCDADLDADCLLYADGRRAVITALSLVLWVAGAVLWQKKQPRRVLSDDDDDGLP